MVCTYHFLKKKKVVIDLLQWHCRNRRKKKLLQLVCGNDIAEIGGKKKLLQLVRGNDITEIVEKKKLFDF